MAGLLRSRKMRDFSYARAVHEMWRPVFTEDEKILIIDLTVGSVQE